MKETLVKLGTGIIAKLLRYGLTAAGGAAISTSPEKGGLNVEQLAAGLSAIIVAFGLSVWEDRVKKKAAESAPFPEAKTPTP